MSKPFRIPDLLPKIQQLVAMHRDVLPDLDTPEGANV